MDEELIIDVRGLQCPLPVLKTAKRMAALGPGACVAVLTTDPMAAIDIPHFCSEKGHRLIASETRGDHMRFVLLKGPPAKDHSP